jgi:catechol 2,3-dioxygenase-like lactoylglutathione lyase family enzyme
MTRIVLWVADLNRSAEFYKDLFGSSGYYLADGFASVAGNGNEVLLHLAPEQYRNDVSLGEDNPIKPVFAVSSIESARQVGLAHNCAFKPETMEHDGVVYLDGMDPDGHVIQVCC